MVQTLGIILPSSLKICASRIITSVCLLLWHRCVSPSKPRKRHRNLCNILGFDLQGKASY